MFIKIFLLTLMALILWGCAKEDVPEAKPVQVNLKGGSGDCISAFGEKIDKFQKGEMNDPDVVAFWSCVQKAVSDFQRLTAGDAEGGGYTPQAIRGFLQRYFLTDSQIGDSLLGSIMEIKRVLLAGQAGVVSREELSRAQEFLTLVREISVELNPHTKIAFLHSESASDEEIEKTGEAVARAFNRLGEWLGTRGQIYSFAQMREFIIHLKEFSGEDGEAAETFENLEKMMDVLPAAKRILLNGHKAAVDGSEWPVLMSSLADSYRALLAVNYAFKENLNAALSRDAIPRGLGFAVNVLERGALAHGKKEIPLAEWQALFEEVNKTGWLSEEFNPDSLMHALRWTLDRALAQGKGDPAAGMNLNHIAVLRTTLENWSMLNRGVKGQGPLKGPVAQRFEQVLAASAPHEWDAEGRLYFAFNPAKTWSAESKARMVWPFVIISWLKDSYVGPEVSDLNDEQMTLAATEILSVLQKFGLMTDTQITIGKKLLRESDLFTLASNGNGGIDLNEGTRYLVFVASSFRAAQLWLEDAEKVCGGREAVCVRRTGADLNRAILSSMPRLQAWLRTDTEKRFVTYVNAAEDTILEEITQGDFSTGDLLQVWMIFQYVETFLQRFDRDFTETVNLREADPAYALFGPTLGSLLAGAVPEDELFGFFTFMMKYGDTPFTMYGGQVAYNHWRWHRNDWAFEAGRTNLMGILNQLSKL